MTITVRPATQDDAESLLAWRNDPETRRWSRTTQPVLPEDHRAWLVRSLQNDRRILLIGDDETGPVGTVRFDRDEDGWEVSITVAPDRRGAGAARPLLAAAEQELSARAGSPVDLRADVHQDNAASGGLFARAGYRPAGAPDDDGFAPLRKTLT